jgi:maltose O-acetyltransferase
MYKLIRKLILQFYGYFIFGKPVHILGRFTVVNTKNIRIGYNCAINHDVFILGREEILIGNNVILSARCMLLDAGFDVDKYMNLDTPDYEYKKSYIHIDDNVWIGAGAIILPRVTVGRNSIIAAGSVVTKSVPPYTIVAGNPAKVIRKLNT